MTSTSVAGFDPGARCLAFAYTGTLPGAPELLHAPSDLDSWLGERFARLDANATERELVDALALRSSIGRIAMAIAGRRAPDADDIDTVNLYAATPDIPPVLDGGRRQAGRNTVRIAQTLSAIARDAVCRFDASVHDRLRRCASDACELVFFDESRSNNRRWCAMQRCGNRAKVNAFRARAVR